MTREDNDLTIAYMAGYHKAKGECKDDFESRICENCKHYIDVYAIHSCFRLDIKEDKDFGCKKFERRKDECKAP